MIGRRRIGACAVLAAVGLALAGCTSSGTSGSNPSPTTSITAGPQAQGVPLPVSGYYWGGTNHNDSGTTPGCTPGSDSIGSQYALLECKMAWAAKQHGLVRPAATTGSGSVVTTMVREYLNGPWGCKRNLQRLQPGGDIYQLAGQSGRKVLMLSTKCGPWSELAAGGGSSAADQDIKTMVDAVAQLPVPVILIFNHEPEDDACGPGGGEGNPDEYRAAYRQFAADVRSEAAAQGNTRISLGWVLQSGTFDMAAQGDDVPFTSCGRLSASRLLPDNPLRNPENFYPGDDVVDWLGTDVYTHGTDHSLSSAVQPFVDWASTACPAKHPATDWSCTSARASKPLALAEFGPGLGTGQPTQQQKAAWFDQIRSDIVSGKTDLSRIKAFAYWSSGQQNVIDSPPDSSHPALIAYTKLSLLSQATTPTLRDATG